MIRPRWPAWRRRPFISRLQIAKATAVRRPNPGHRAAKAAAEAETTEAVTAFDNDAKGEPRQEIIPVEVVPVNLPVQSVVSPAKLDAG